MSAQPPPTDPPPPHLPTAPTTSDTTTVLRHLVASQYALLNRLEKLETTVLEIQNKNQNNPHVIPTAALDFRVAHLENKLALLQSNDRRLFAVEEEVSRVGEMTQKLQERIEGCEVSVDYVLADRPALELSEDEDYEMVEKESDRKAVKGANEVAQISRDGLDGKGSGHGRSGYKMPLMGSLVNTSYFGSKKPVVEIDIKPKEPQRKEIQRRTIHEIGFKPKKPQRRHAEQLPHNVVELFPKENGNTFMSELDKPSHVEDEQPVIQVDDSTDQQPKQGKQHLWHAEKDGKNSASGQAGHETSITDSHAHVRYFGNNVPVTKPTASSKDQTKPGQQQSEHVKDHDYPSGPHGSSHRGSTTGSIVPIKNNLFFEVLSQKTSKDDITLSPNNECHLDAEKPAQPVVAKESKKQRPVDSTAGQDTGTSATPSFSSAAPDPETRTKITSTSTLNPDIQQKTKVTPSIVKTDRPDTAIPTPSPSSSLQPHNQEQLYSIPSLFTSLHKSVTHFSSTHLTARNHLNERAHLTGTLTTIAQQILSSPSLVTPTFNSSSRQYLCTALLNHLLLNTVFSPTAFLNWHSPETNLYQEKLAKHLLCTTSTSKKPVDADQNNSTRAELATLAATAIRSEGFKPHLQSRITDVKTCLLNNLIFLIPATQLGQAAKELREIVKKAIVIKLKMSTLASEFEIGFVGADTVFEEEKQVSVTTAGGKGDGEGRWIVKMGVWPEVLERGVEGESVVCKAGVLVERRDVKGGIGEEEGIGELEMG